MKRGIFATVTIALLTGCSLTPDYGCKAPDGVTCMSASEVYDRDRAGQVIKPKLDKEKSSWGAPDEHFPAPRRFAGPAPVTPGTPVFREPLRLRVWVVDWEDVNNVYHPNHYLFLRVDNGEWVLPLMRERHLENPDGLLD